MHRAWCALLMFTLAGCESLDYRDDDLKSSLASAKRVAIVPAIGHYWIQSLDPDPALRERFDPVIAPELSTTIYFRLIQSGYQARLLTGYPVSDEERHEIDLFFNKCIESLKRKQYTVNLPATITHQSGNDILLFVRYEGYDKDATVMTLEILAALLTKSAAPNSMRRIEYMAIRASDRRILRYQSLTAQEIYSLVERMIIELEKPNAR